MNDADARDPAQTGGPEEQTETVGRTRCDVALATLGALVAALLVAPGLGALTATSAWAAGGPQGRGLPATSRTVPAQRVLAGTVLVPRPRHGEARYGVDVSWPQCGAPLPQVPLDFALVGITHGHAGSVSPCAVDQAAWAHQVRANLGVYVVPNSPDATTLQRADALPRAATACPDATPACRSYRVGVVQAGDAMRAVTQMHLTPRSWWLDVEETPGGTLWSRDTAANVGVLRGWVGALRSAGHRVGVYSTGGYWDMITGGWRVNLPEWVAVGEAGLGAARQGCATPFSAGPVLLTQWLTGPIDGDLVCPGQRSLAVAFLGPWRRVVTAGVPDVLTIPVPHPHPAAAPKQRRHHRHHHPKPVGQASATPVPAPHARTRPAPSTSAKPPSTKPTSFPPPLAPSAHPAAPPAPAATPPRPAPSRTPPPTPTATATPTPTASSSPTAGDDTVGTFGSAVPTP